MNCFRNLKIEVYHIVLITLIGYMPAVIAEQSFFMGSSMFMLANLDSETEHPPNFYQLNLGYKISAKDSISLELITWRYDAPLGIPYGDSLGKEAENYPGYVRSKGIGIAYQRFLTEKLYTAIHATIFSQDYNNEDDELIDRGRQLFLTFRLGYHIDFFSNWFIEPSIAFNYWPINSNLPASFQEKEDKWNNYFLLEPGLHFGMFF